MITHSRPYITEEDINAVRKVLQSENIAKGEKTLEFENALCGYLGTKSAFVTASGTSALILGLKALGVKENDEVILPTYVCKNVTVAINNLCAVPVLCDIGDEWNMTVQTIKPRITPRTKAIIIVHIFGIPAASEEIKELGIPVIEDCCQAFGAEVSRKIIGSDSELAMYSFHATKCLTTGEGGALTSNNAKITSRIEELLAKNFISSTMTNIQAALGLSQMKKYSRMLSKRRKIAERYFEEIRDDNIILPNSVKEKSIFFRFPIRIKKMDFEAAKKKFFNDGIHIRRGVDALLHRENGFEDKDFPAATGLFNETVSIPIYPALNEEEQKKVIEAIKKYIYSGIIR